MYSVWGLTAGQMVNNLIEKSSKKQQAIYIYIYFFFNPFSIKNKTRLPPTASDNATYNIQLEYSFIFTI